MFEILMYFFIIYFYYCGMFQFFFINYLEDLINFFIEIVFLQGILVEFDRVLEYGFCKIQYIVKCYVNMYKNVCMQKYVNLSLNLG